MYAHSSRGHFAGPAYRSVWRVGSSVRSGPVPATLRAELLHERGVALLKAAADRIGRIAWTASGLDVLQRRAARRRLLAATGTQRLRRRAMGFDHV